MISFAIQEIYDNLNRINESNNEFKKDDVINFLRKLLHLHQNLSRLIDKSQANIDYYQDIRLNSLILSLEQDQEKYILNLKTNEEDELKRINDRIVKFINEIVNMYNNIKGISKQESSIGTKIEHKPLSETVQNTQIESKIEPTENVGPIVFDIRREKRDDFFTNTPLDKDKIFRKEMDQRRECENEMLELTEKMRGIAMSYTDHLKNDDKILEKLQIKQELGLRIVRKKNMDLDDLLVKFGTLSWWRLIIMTIIALILFFLTASFIIFDRMVFGK